MDVLARLVAQELTNAMGQQFVVDNRPGAGGNLAIEALVKAPADGYTILVVSVGLASNPSLYRKVPYRMEDLSPISLVSEAAMLIMATPALPANTIPELIALAKAKPGTVRSAVLSGGASQFASDTFRFMADIDLLNVPYKGGPQMFIDAMGGNLDLVVLPIPESIQQVKSKRIKALGQTGKKRSALAPDVPTVEEAGLKGYQSTAWHMVVGSSKMPKEIVNRLNQEISKILKNPQTQAKLTNLGIDVIDSSPEQAAAFLKSEHDRFAKLIRWSGTKLE